MAGANRTGRVSSINYAAGTYEVTYFDRGKSVTKQINAMANGEYKMPSVGQIVSVSHNSNGSAAATTTGSVWNKSNKPAEGFKGLYRKEYGEKKGQAYSRYDANTGVYTQYIDKRTGRTCNGEIYDEAKGPISFIAGGQVQLKSDGASASIQSKTGTGIVAGTTINMEAGTFFSIETGTDMSTVVGGKRTLEVTGATEESYKGSVAKSYAGKVTKKFKGDIKHEVEAKIEATATGDITLTLNGTTVTINEAGEVSIESPVKIDLTAPEINIDGATGKIIIDGVSLTEHTHKDGGAGEPEK